MIKNTLILVGPGGIGKGPLDHILKDHILKIDPYRMRPTGPRNNDDTLYANPKLRDELHLVCQALNLSFVCLSPIVEWFPTPKLLFFKVRNNWQLLILEGIDADIGKAEIYAPVIPVLFSQPQIRHIFGKTEVVVIHSGANMLGNMSKWTDLENETEKNCRLRGDDKDSITNRKNSIKEEAPIWKKMIEQGATEYENWQFSEHTYQSKAIRDKVVLAHQVPILLRAKKALMKKNSRLEVFFKTDDEIKNISKPIVKSV